MRVDIDEPSGNAIFNPEYLKYVYFDDPPNIGNMRFVDYMNQQQVADPSRYKIAGPLGSRQLLDRGVAIATEVPGTAGKPPDHPYVMSHVGSFAPYNGTVLWISPS